MVTLSLIFRHMEDTGSTVVAIISAPQPHWPYSYVKVGRFLLPGCKEPYRVIAMTITMTVDNHFPKHWMTSHFKWSL